MTRVVLLEKCEPKSDQASRSGFLNLSMTFWARSFLVVYVGRDGGVPHDIHLHSQMASRISGFYFLDARIISVL